MAVEPMRVAVFVPTPFVGGVGSCLMNYFRRIDRSRFVMDFFVSGEVPDGLAAEIVRLGGRIVRLPPIKRLPVYLKATAEVLRGYRIVHANLNTLNVFPLLAARRAKVPVRIAHAHATSSPAEPLRHLVKLVLRPLSRPLATRFLACSEAAGRWQFGAAAGGRATVLKNAVDLGRFAFDRAKREDIRKRLGLEGCAVVGFVGRLVSAKNPSKLLSVFRALAVSRDDVRLLIVGDGPAAERMRAHLASERLLSRAVFVGRQDDPSSFYSAMDAFVFPSLYEGLGMTLVEAQACGLSCVASDHVPVEADVTGRVRFVPLRAKDGIWAGAVAEALAAGRKPELSHARVAAAGYDISAAARTLEEIYAADV